MLGKSRISEPLSSYFFRTQGVKNSWKDLRYHGIQQFNSKEWNLRKLRSRFFWDQIDVDEIDDDDDVDEIDDDDDDDVDDVDDVLVEDGNPSWCTRLVNDTTMRPEFSTRCVEVWSNMTCQRVFTNKACCACREHVYPWCVGKDWSLKLSCLFPKMANELEESMGTDECVHDVFIYMVLVEMISFIQKQVAFLCIFHIQIPS